MMIDQQRYNDWVQLSLRLNPFVPFMITNVQGLGKLDAQLVSLDREFLADREVDLNNLQVYIALTDRFTYSYLWVLGAYEIVRAIDQRCREARPPFVTNEMAKTVLDTKRDFERVRVPLAKFEASRRHEKTDSTVAFPAINVEDGVAWHISEDTFISRYSLSCKFMEMLRCLPD